MTSWSMWPTPMRQSICYVSLGLRSALAVELPASLVGVAEPAIAEPRVLVVDIEAMSAA
jgi:hypothetical protein